MHTFVNPGERAFAILTSGSVSLTQSVITLLREDFNAGKGLAEAASPYAASRVVGEAVRKVSDLDRAALEKDDFSFNINLLLGGQVKGSQPGLFLIYPQGNPLSATHDSPYLQIGECKYGRPILDRGIDYGSTPLDVAAIYGLLSFDAAMRSNITVGPPIEMLIYHNDSLHFDCYKSFAADNPELLSIHKQWERALRKAVEDLPKIDFNACLPGR